MLDKAREIENAFWMKLAEERRADDLIQHALQDNLVSDDDRFYAWLYEIEPTAEEFAKKESGSVRLPRESNDEGTGSIKPLIIARSLTRRSEVRKMISTIAAVCAASLAVPVTAQERLTLWQNIEAGMTADEVRALYPDARQRRGGIFDGGRIDIRDYEPLEGCGSTARIHFEDGVVGAVEIRGAGAVFGRCSSQIEESLIAKYGPPHEQDVESGWCFDGECMTETWTSAWINDGVAMRYRKLDGQGLASASWVMEYVPVERILIDQEEKAQIGL